MIKTVEERQRGGFDFSSHYDNLCALQNSCPLPVVKSNLDTFLLDINGDRIRPTDWMPILNTVKINRTLKAIAFRSYYQETLADAENKPYQVKRKPPAIRSKEITYRLCKSLKDCLLVTPTLSSILLQGVPLRERDLTALTKGLMKSRTVREISFESCGIGDNGLEIVLKGIKNSSTISTVNFSACNLTFTGADNMAKLIKHQAMRRHNEAWQDSLRYRRPDLDRMAGVRRITLNNNVLIGDEGGKCLAEALRDDLWVKAVDMQFCGITDEGAKAFLEVLRFNTSLIVLDIRRNPVTDNDLLDRISEQVIINSDGRQTEFKWLEIHETPKSDISTRSSTPSSKKKKSLRQLQSKIQKTSIRVNSAASTPRRRSLSAGNIKPGMPWRTAARACRYRGYPPDTPKSGDINSDGISTTIDDTDANDSPVNRGRYLHSQQVELESLKRKLDLETEARKQAEKEVLELRIKMEKLQCENEDLKEQAVDCDELENIQATLDEFHEFIDLLNKNGLGKIVEMATLDQINKQKKTSPTSSQ